MMENYKPYEDDNRSILVEGGEPVVAHPLVVEDESTPPTIPSVMVMFARPLTREQIQANADQMLAVLEMMGQHEAVEQARERVQEAIEEHCDDDTPNYEVLSGFQAVMN